jgi:DNA-binding transcriptional ArsR family regulator
MSTVDQFLDERRWCAIAVASTSCFFCEHLDMARQSATQHIGILEAANLVSTVRRGREKLHFINPVPLHEVYERWVRKFERQRLSLLHDLKKELEGE